MKTNSAIRQASLAKLKGNWGVAILAALVYLLIAVALSAPDSIYQVINLTPSYYLFGGSMVATIFLMLPLGIGLYNAYKKFYNEDDKQITRNMFVIGFDRYWHNVGGFLLMTIFIILWTILLIIPGLIMSLAYFCTPFILVDNPELSPMEAIKKSKKMMCGHKWDLFLMTLGFLGFTILSIFTLGIALIWLCPYMYNTCAAFYTEVKADYEAKNQQ